MEESENLRLFPNYLADRFRTLAGLIMIKNQQHRIKITVLANKHLSSNLPELLIASALAHDVANCKIQRNSAKCALIVARGNS